MTADQVTESTEETAAVEQTQEPVQLPNERIEGARLVALLEALLFASSEPLAVEQLTELTRASAEEIETAANALAEKCRSETSGIELVRVAGKYQLRTDPSFAPYVRALKIARPRRLSAAALETLSVVAYRQPIVKSDIDQIRGVDVAPTLKTLLERGLVRIIGHKPTVGAPALYGTTEEFLKIFGIDSLAALPSLRDIEELENEPGEPVDAAPEVTAQ